MRTMITIVMGALLLTGMVTVPAMAASADGQDSQMAHDNEASASTRGERLSGSAIRDTVMGHRVTGAMADGSRYSEVYRVDGTIEGENYTGQATIEGDRMCLDYGSGETTCYQVQRTGDNRIEWLLDNEVVGEGTLSDVE
ncbi:hypothetical protein SAMN05421848_2324 [Kushneria avicenniae]|uniref:Uncharacterized protein n=1 Tax=Kushneria avicenniae TaxID=402385 RepID=A0A1I1L1L4_9GAMM|nr:hypothetical protein [Kushneria avicenniae]SFC66957.1 hypothetical protein SAMN05421848_2324 [Kushneria avicenniae]